MSKLTEVMITELQQLAKELGKVPSAVDCNKCSYTANSSTYTKRFGSWNAAKEAAGLSLSNKFSIKTDEELLNSLRQFYSINGRPPKFSECRVENGLSGPNTYKDRFGGWNNAIKASGLDTITLRNNQVDDQCLLDSLFRFYKENNRAPRHEDCNSGEYDYLKSHMVYTRRFETFTNALNLAKVPLNATISSIKEKSLLNAIKEIYGGEILENHRILPDGTEIDIYLPQFKLGIEFNGLYWHSDKFKSKHYHVIKTNMANSIGIRLIHIFENEWSTKKDIVLNRLKHIISKSEMTYARKCSIRSISSGEATLFLDKCHIQGGIACSINLGLFYNNSLVAVQTYSKSRFSRKYEYELVRYAGNVVGGASKLFKYFIKHHKPTSIVSYSDIRWNTGKLYTNLGFKLSHISDPNYWYFKGQKLESRHKYQKHKLANILPKFDENLTEYDNMVINGYGRIFDCGNMVFVYNTLTSEI